MVFTIRAFVTFFTIIDPVGLAPVVIGLTAHLSDAQRSIIVTRAVIISAIIIAFFALVGNFLLARLGIKPVCIQYGIVEYVHISGLVK